MKRKNLNKLVLFLLLGTLVAPLLSPALVFAQTPPPSSADNKDCEWYNMFCWMRRFFTWVTQAIMAIMLFVVGVFINLAVGLIELMIQSSAGVIGLPIVQTGVGITLGLANLGFVLAIIIIAFATILRIERYALKQTLSKLIIAAVLVNFSLAIAGVLLDFTNVLATFFVSKVAPGGLGGTAAFGAQMASALQIQQLTDIKSATSLPTLGLASALDLGVSLFADLLSLFAALIFSIMIFFVFFGIALMLLVRYIFLAILLMLMPLAWLFWVIPDLESYWHKWWSQFLKWTFFLPAVTFFLYLAMFTAPAIDTTVKSGFNQGSTTLGASNKYIAQNIGAEGFLALLIKLGLFAGALVAGNAMGVTGSSIAMSGMKKAGGWAAGKLQTAVQRRAEAVVKPLTGLGQRVGEGLQGARFDTSKGNFLTKNLKRIGNLATIPVRKAGTGLAAGSIQGQEALLKSAEDRQKNMSDREVGTRFSSMTRIEQAAAMTRLRKSKSLKLIPRLADTLADEKTEATFKSLGKDKDYGDLEIAFGRSGKMIRSATILKGNPESKFKQEMLQNATREFNGKLHLDDYSNMGREVFDDYDEKKSQGLDRQTHEILRNSQIEGMAAHDPGSLSRVMPKLSGAALYKFNTDAATLPIQRLISEGKIKDEIDVRVVRNGEFVTGTDGKPVTEKKKLSETILKQRVQWLQDSDDERLQRIGKSLAHNSSSRITGITYETSQPGQAGAGAAPAAPSPPPAGATP